MKIIFGVFHNHCHGVFADTVIQPSEALVLPMLVRTHQNTHMAKTNTMAKMTRKTTEMVFIGSNEVYAKRSVGTFFHPASMKHFSLSWKYVRWVA